MAAGIAGIALVMGMGRGVDEKSGSVEAVTRPHYDAQLGFPITGKVERVLVKPGDLVEKGQELIKLDDALPLAQLTLLELRAASGFEIDAAQADWDLSKLQRQLITDSYKKQAATELEVERAVLEAEKARLALELFKQRREESQRQVKEGRERQKQFVLVAPRSGVVDRLIAEPGEVVQEQRPVLRLVDTSVLRVEAAIPTERSLSMKPGQAVWVVYKDGDRTVHEARVVSLAQVADSGSATRLTRIEFENTDKSPAGRTVDVWLDRPKEGGTEEAKHEPKS